MSPGELLTFIIVGAIVGLLVDTLAAGTRIGIIGSMIIGIIGDFLGHWTFLWLNFDLPESPMITNILSATIGALLFLLLLRALRRA